MFDINKFLPMTGFELHTSGIGSHRSTNWATTNSHTRLPVSFCKKVMIGSIAKNVHLLKSHVVWTQMALEAAKTEGKSPTFIAKVKKIVSQAQMEHDEVILVPYLGR